LCYDPYDLDGPLTREQGFGSRHLSAFRDALTAAGVADQVDWGVLDGKAAVEDAEEAVSLLRQAEEAAEKAAWLLSGESRTKAFGAAEAAQSACARAQEAVGLRTAVRNGPGEATVLWVGPTAYGFTLVPERDQGEIKWSGRSLSRDQAQQIANIAKAHGCLGGSLSAAKRARKEMLEKKLI
jgi:hypothetical protein